MLFTLLGLHLICALLVLMTGSRLGRGVWLVAGAAPAAVVIWLVTEMGALVGGASVSESVEWVAGLGLTLDLRVDAFAALMLVLVAGIGVLVFAYAWRYFADSPLTTRASGFLTLFAGSMVGVVITDNLLALYAFWELTSVTSYLLIGLDDAVPDARAAAQQAWLTTVLGGLVMLGGFVTLGVQAGTFRISELVAAPPSGTAVGVALVLVLIGAFTKSAQYPFHAWLPAAMVAPTPISAYLHSAAMVKAGVYLVARLAPAFADVGIWRPVVVVVGLTTMIAGGLRALRPFDLKQLLAFGTISQLGFLVVLLGIGRPAATAAGCALLLAHGFFKAALFMVVGIVDRTTGTRDIRDLPSLGAGWGPTRIVALVSAASMAAIPPLAGFVAKEAAYGALVDGTSGDRLVLAGIVIGSVLTVAYSLRFAVALVRPELVSGCAEAEGSASTSSAATAAAMVERPAAERSPSPWFIAPGIVLAAGSILGGVVPFLWSGLVDTAAHSLDLSSHADLSLWHGFNLPLGLSFFTLTAGALVFLQRRRTEAAQSRLTFPISGQRGYEATLRGLLGLADRTTRVAQAGSLPVYTAVIMSTVAIAPLVAMLTGSWWSGWPEWLGSPAHVPVAAIIIGGSIAAAVAGRRFAAAILLGVVGYGMALLFVVQGAPDLALTQFTIETLSVVVFLLVLRVLPDRFEKRSTTIRQPLRITISAVAGLFVVIMGLAIAGLPAEPTIAREMSEQALPAGGGRNVVNVILVDIRGWDTLGEISVLFTAAIGVVAIARIGRPRREIPSRRGERAVEEVTSRS